MSTTSVPASVNGNLAAPREEAVEPVGPLERLRRAPANVHLFRGFGPLVVGAVLFVLMVALAPSVAPERTVERPVEAATQGVTGDPGATDADGAQP